MIIERSLAVVCQDCRRSWVESKKPAGDHFNNSVKKQQYPAPTGDSGGRKEILDSGCILNLEYQKCKATEGINSHE